MTITYVLYHRSVPGRSVAASLDLAYSTLVFRAHGHVVGFYIPNTPLVTPVTDAYESLLQHARTAV